MADSAVGWFEIDEGLPIVTYARPVTSSGADVFAGDVASWRLDAYDITDDDAADTTIFTIENQTDATLIMFASLQFTATWPYEDGFSFKHYVPETAFPQHGEHRYHLIYTLNTFTSGPVKVRTMGRINPLP